ncbi:MAG: MerR family transcriptional regulator [Deltaproteobacteria bacterium]|nr:MerR family transcriptional regulator [Deltaproteobacteria bacterium]MBW1953446.1 MerR family transcriptional regulator [Deltaproteobacteria bacterium]MBW1987500.1 MerR family transcriptional regulator [Deltaproteobacteria bacterium]MBW2135619.1 MerR family transcriptional regulator [Deltaproteobacteria bacterium]
MPQLQKRYYSIQAVAQTLGVHPQAIRLYEREGLITSVRSGKNRYYALRQIERLRVILQLRQELGVNLAGIEVILNMRDRLMELQKTVAELSGPGTSTRRPSPPAPPLEPPRIIVKEET